MADLINATDSLNTGRFKINAIIEDASAAVIAVESASATAGEAKTTANSVQTQLDTIILVDGASDAEVVQSRVDKDGKLYATLKERLDSSDAQLAERAPNTVYLRSHQTEIETLGLNAFMQNKLDSGCTKFVIPVGTVLNETLQLKNIRNFGTQAGITIQGEDGGNDMYASRPHLILNTGGVGVSMIETHSVILENLNMSDQGADNPSNVGILMSRDSTFHDRGSSHTNRLKNVSVKLRDDMTANSGKGTIGIYNDTSETATYEGLMITANLPMVLTRRDVFNLNPLNTYEGSNLDHYFVGFNSFMSYGKPESCCILMDGCENVNGTLYTHTANATDTSCAIKITGGTGIAAGNININSEATPIVFHLKDSYMQGVTVTGIATMVKKFIKTERTMSPTMIDGCEFNCYVGFVPDTPKIYIENGASAIIENSVLKLMMDMTNVIFDNYGVLQGSEFQAQSIPTINNFTGHTYVGNVFRTPAGLLTNAKSKVGGILTGGSTTLDFGIVSANTTKGLLYTHNVDVNTSRSLYVLARLNYNLKIADGLMLDAFVQPNETNKIYFRVSNITAQDISVGALSLNFSIFDSR